MNAGHVAMVRIAPQAKGARNGRTITNETTHRITMQTNADAIAM
jgi:hypothetical protein